MTPVFAGAIGASVTRAVALTEGATRQCLVRSCSRSSEQDRRPVGEKQDDGGGISVGGAYGYAAAGGDLRESDVLAQAGENTKARLYGGSLPRRPSSRVAMGNVTRSITA
ncbi:hypothetical protein ABZ154_19690 [Streptomyces sp. NPDC006261]|uniref:hypothetical protein n=1 Tax=Streptomyces sp. NPDC006261 TaxID=3156739 RepID=UPI0033A86132